jgi:hypothetical protein
MKKTKSLSDRLDLTTIQSGINVVVSVLMKEVDKTDWNHFIQTHRGAINALSSKFSKFYADDEKSLTMVAHYFGDQLAKTLKELEDTISKRRLGHPTSSVMIARLQATILIWKQQLEYIWTTIESEQESEPQPS